MLVRAHERGAGPQHAVHLAQQPIHVLDLTEHACAEREVDRIRP